MEYYSNLVSMLALKTQISNLVETTSRPFDNVRLGKVRIMFPKLNPGLSASKPFTVKGKVASIDADGYLGFNSW